MIPYSLTLSPGHAPADILTTPWRLPAPVRLTFVTGNPGKLQEARQVLGPGIELDQDAHGYAEVQADTLEEVARAGLEFLAARLDPPFFLEDSGLFIDALSGFPGVYSAYVYKTLGCPGVLSLLEGVGDDRRTARFEAVIGYRDPDGHDHLFKGSVDGWIASQERGSHGFGFDPVFTPKALAQGPNGPSFAQLDPAEKNRLSHRGRAFSRFRESLQAAAGNTAPERARPSK